MRMAIHKLVNGNLFRSFLLIAAIFATPYFNGTHGLALASDAHPALVEDSEAEDEQLIPPFDEVDLKSLTMLRTSTN